MDRICVVRLEALADNYVWLVVDQREKIAVAVDPSEPQPVLRALKDLGVRLVAIWNTHHHGDHVGGNLDLLSTLGPLEVAASAYDGEHARVPGQTRHLSDGDVFEFGGAEVRVLFIPGHTLGHIALVLGEHLFCGDTLFGACCGRLFEGTPEMMQRSLLRLRELPDDTLVHCGHEYTHGCLRFALEVDPDNPALRARHQRCLGEKATIPSRLGDEKATNPFLRWDAPAIRAATGEEDPVAVFAALRRKKDTWKG
jgi:hydroxyacylglutathione hydrolase